MASTDTRTRPVIRQDPNPDGNTRRPQVPGRERTPEWCPWHGQYVPPWSVYTLQNRARSGEDPVDTSRYRLDMAARLRRRCPECNEQHPTGPQWAIIVRHEVERLQEWDLQSADRKEVQSGP